ncbi:MAG: hypothetical protein K6A40_03805 [Solobacterium sp.]|nr:hypothetical protein [Solobacterium sp.]
MEKPTFRDKFQYWFDNRMSDGSVSLIRLLILFTAAAVLLLTGLIIGLGLSGEKDVFGVFWDSLSTIINAWMPSSEDGSLGYVLLMSIAAIAGLLVTSVLIGIVTSAMEEKITGLRKGNSPVLEKDHIIVLGFYPGEYTLIRQLILAADDEPCVIVIGAEMERDEMEQHIEDNIDVPANVRIICRTVDMFDPASIERLSTDTCRTIIISPTDDNTTIKALLAVSPLFKDRKIRVNAITSRDENRFPPNMAKKLNVMTLQTNDTMAKIIAHSCTQTGLSEVFREIFNFEGSELYLIRLADQEGLTFMELMSRVDHAVPAGIYRDHEMIMNPDTEMRVKENDRILVFSEKQDSAVLCPEAGIIVDPDTSREIIRPERDTKTLIFGHNRTLRTVLRELPENVQKVTLVNYDGSDNAKLAKICADKEIDFVLAEGNVREELGLLELCRNAEHIILLSSHDKDEEEADMETIFLLLNLRELREKYHLRFNITAEMRREKNQSLIATDDHTDFIVASNMSSLFLAQLAESPRLLTAFRELLSNEGNELFMKTAGNLGCTGEKTVCEIRQILYYRGYIFLGYMNADNSYTFNPPLTETLNIRKSDRLIVLGRN